MSTEAGEGVHLQQPPPPATHLLASSPALSLISIIFMAPSAARGFSALHSDPATKSRSPSQGCKAARREHTGRYELIEGIISCHSSKQRGMRCHGKVDPVNVFSFRFVSTLIPAR